MRAALLLIASAAVAQALSVSVDMSAKAMAQLSSPKTLELLAANARLNRVRGAMRKQGSSLLQSNKTRSMWEDLEPWKDSFMAVRSIVEAEHVSSLTAGITGDSYKQVLTEFTEHSGSRYIGHAGNHKAAEHIMAKFEQAGFTTSEHPFEYELPRSLGFKQLSATAQAMPALLKMLGQRTGNVVGFKKGTDLHDQVILLGAHFDSVNWRDFGKDAPGVDDNASGIAALLLIAEALKKHQPRRSVLLVAFNAEEEGLLGSKSFVKTSKDEFGTIKAAIIMDEIAFPGRSHVNEKAIFETVGRSEGVQTILDTMAHQTEDPMGKITGFEINHAGFGSDHMPFLDEGIPAVLLIERDDEWHADSVGHSSDDTYSGLSMDFGAKMTRLALRSAVHLANPSN